MKKRAATNIKIQEGTIRVKTSDLKPYIKTKKSWKLSDKRFPELLNSVNLFKAHGNLKILIDKKDPGFLKGQLSPEGKIQGARINILPDGRVLDKAYSLFAKNLAIHDEESNDHWDVLYQNPGGTYSHAYTLEKKKAFTKNKYKAVEKFEKKHKKLERNVLKALKDKNDSLALPMYTLLKTSMRIGNETYYKADGHKGLTTLKKKDISINKDKVIFNYVAKDGVPINLQERFPQAYIKRLKQEIKNLKNSDFVFADSNKKPLKDTHFMKAFEKYCGERFYPHIVRSFYATEKAKEFLKKHRSASKEEINSLFSSIAEKLGHKKFVRKENKWKDNYNVTIHYYLNPQILEKVNSIVR